MENVFVGYKLVASLGCLLCSEYNLSLRVLVGPYSTLTADPAADKLATGVGASGVYARFVDRGRRLDLLDQSGQCVDRHQVVLDMRGNNLDGQPQDQIRRTGLDHGYSLALAALAFTARC